MADREDRERNWRRRGENQEIRESSSRDWDWGENRSRDADEDRDRDRNWSEPRNRDFESRNRTGGQSRNQDFEGRERGWFEGRDRDWGQGMNRDRSSGFGYRGQYGFEGRGGRGGEFSGRSHSGYGRGEFGGRGQGGGYEGQGRGDWGGDFGDNDEYSEDYGGRYSTGFGGEGYGRGQEMRGSGEGRRDRGNYGQSGWEGRGRGYGGGFQERGRYGGRGQAGSGGWEGTQGDAGWRYDDDFDTMDYDDDMDTYLTYTEYWYIPGPFSGVGPETYHRSNERIEEDVNERLTHHGQIDAKNIQVRVDNGDVTITGTVKNRQMKRMAEDVIDSVWGVQNINNELKVQDRQQEQSGRQEQQFEGKTAMQDPDQKQNNES